MQVIEAGIKEARNNLEGAQAKRQEAQATLDLIAEKNRAATATVAPGAVTSTTEIAAQKELSAAIAEVTLAKEKLNAVQASGNPAAITQAEMGA